MSDPRRLQSRARGVDDRLLIQLSDVHVTADGLLHGLVDPLKNLRTILDSLEASGDRIDLVLFTGDLADSGEPRAYDRFRSVVEPALERIGAPGLFVPGNHDARASFRKGLLDEQPSEDPIDQVRWCGGLRVIALDSTVPGSHHGELDDAQLEFLASELTARASLGTVLALHHPPVPGPSEVLNELTLRNPDALAAVVAGSDVRMIVAGHTHHLSCGALAGIPVFVATATAYQMDVPAASRLLRGISGSGYARIDVGSNHIVATAIPVLPSSKPLYEIDVETLRRFIDGSASEAEVERAFTASAQGESD